MNLNRLRTNCAITVLSTLLGLSATAETFQVPVDGPGSGHVWDKAPLDGVGDGAQSSGASKYLSAGIFDKTPNNQDYRTYLRFTLPAEIATGASLQSATLRVYHYQRSGAVTADATLFHNRAENTSANLESLRSSLFDDAGFAPTGMVVATPTTPNGSWIELDVTDLVKQDLDQDPADNRQTWFKIQSAEFETYVFFNDKSKRYLFESEQAGNANPPELVLETSGSGGGGDGGGGTGGGGGNGEPSDLALFAAGYVNVVDFGAIPDDELDDTAAIRAAIAAAYSDSIEESRAVYFPTGIYLISDTIEVRRPSTADMTAWRPSHYLIGARERPTLKLMPSAEGFGDPNHPKTMLFILGEWRGQPGVERIGDHFNTLFRNFIVDTGTGNSGAVGIDFAAAEGCCLYDVTVHTSDPASTFFAGVTGIPGSGGSVVGLEVIGGNYGIYCPDFDTAGTNTLVAASRFIDQTTAAIHYRSYTPITVVGFEVKKQNGPVFEFRGSGHETSANASFIDGTIELTNPSPGPGAVGISHFARNMVLRNVYVKGIDAIVADVSGNPDFSDFTATDSTQWEWIENYADGPHYAFSVNGATYGGRMIDGSIRNEPDQVPLIARDPTVDHIAKHKWTAGLGTFDRPDVIDVKVAPFNATGDGVTDDTAAIQAALDAASLTGAPVFLSKGRYVITSPLQLHANTELFGVSHAISMLDGRTMTSDAIGSGGAAVVRSDDSAGSLCAVSDLKIMVPPSGQGIAGIYWQAGRNSMIRDIWTIRVSEGPQDNAAVARAIITGNGGGRIYNWLCHSGYDTTNQGTRNMVIDGTIEPLTFYMLHNQHMRSPYGIRWEARNASNIAIYAAKHEDNANAGLPVPFSFENCDNVQVFGVTGIGETREDRGIVEFHDSTNYSVCNIGVWGGGEATAAEPFYYTQEYFSGSLATQIYDSNKIFVNELRRGHPDYTTGDAVPPTVFLTSPTAGSVLEAAVPVNLTAEARDAQGVALVEFYSDLGGLLGDDDAAPYATTWSPMQLGSHFLYATAYDGENPYQMATSDLVEVFVQDTTPPVIDSLFATPNSLSPPNHKMKPISITASGHDTAGPVTFSIVGVTSNEPINGTGDGNTDVDWLITGPLNLELRAERAGNGNGRVYTIQIQAIDQAGNVTTGSTTVTVPKGK